MLKQKGRRDPGLAERRLWTRRLRRLALVLNAIENNAEGFEMTTTVTPGSFTIERKLDSAPAKVFAALGDARVRKQLFGVTEDGPGTYRLDFELGGHEYNVGPGPGGKEFVYDAEFRDIVENRRVVYSYEMLMGGQRLSVSVASIELLPEGAGTLLRLEEVGLYFDGLDTSAQREAGTTYLIATLCDMIDKQ